MIASNFKAEKEAQDLLEKYYLPHPSEVNLLDILGNEKLSYQERSLKSSLGNLIRQGNYGQIVVDKKVSNSHQKRFIISHELGHWFLHKDMPLFNCDKSKFKYWNKSINILEKEANWFASEFLMPKKSFIEFCEGKVMSRETIELISKFYNVSITAAAIRFANFGSESILVVYCKDDIVQWSYPSKDFPFSFFEKGYRVPRSSITYKSFRTRKDIEVEDVSLAKSWFSNDFTVKENTYLNEVIFSMPNYQSCLTILWQHELNFKKY